jgi:Xaa-Pro aminopeptidase
MTRHAPARSLSLARWASLALAGLVGLSAGAGLTAQTPEQRYTDWALPTFPAAEYASRRAAMLSVLADDEVLLVPSADGVTHGETFRQLDDFLYFTGLELPRSMLVLDGGDDTATLFAPARDERFENPGRPNDFPGRPLGSDPAVAALAGLKGSRDVSALGAALDRWISEGRTLIVNRGTAGPQAPPHTDYVGAMDPIETLVTHLHAAHPGAVVANAYEAIAGLRMRKSPAELDVLGRAATATTEAIRTTAAQIRPGVTESSLQGIFEGACRRQGALQIPFTPIVKSGPNSLWPWRILAAHADRRDRALEDGEVVILDVGCAVDGYVSDVGRSFPVGGRFSDLQRAKLAMITRVSDAIIAAVRPGVTLPDLTRAAYEAIPDGEEPYMQAPSFFGHHLGLSSGDPSLLHEALAPGMVFTIEPWYYNHDLGVSVFVEDVVRVTATGAEVLTRALPRSPEELERMVR